MFATNRGTARQRSNITRQVLAPAIRQANTTLTEAGHSPIAGVTNHSLRRTYCAILFEAGASPAYVMAQMGHADPNLALAIYAQVMERARDTGERMDALIRGAEWALTGTNRTEAADRPDQPVVPTESVSAWLGGKWRGCGAGTRTPTT